MQPGRHAVAPEQQDAEEGGLEEERGHDLVVEQRAQHVAGAVREPAPVGAELERHDDARDHPHAERDREDPGPELGQLAVERAPGREPARLEHDQPGREPDRERREQDVERDRDGELHAGQEEGVEVHLRSTVVTTRRGPPSKRPLT